MTAFSVPPQGYFLSPLLCLPSPAGLCQGPGVSLVPGYQVLQLLLLGEGMLGPLNLVRQWEVGREGGKPRWQTSAQSEQHL